MQEQPKSVNEIAEHTCPIIFGIGLPRTFEPIIPRFTARLVMVLIGLQICLQSSLTTFHNKNVPRNPTGEGLRTLVALSRASTEEDAGSCSHRGLPLAQPPPTIWQREDLRGLDGGSGR